MGRRRIGLVIAGLALALVGATAIPLHTAWQRAVLLDPPASHFVVDRHGRYIAQISTGAAGQYGYWRSAELPERVAEATLALEDRRFWYHPGVDPIGVLRAAVQNARHGGIVSGASTIAMQVARIQDPAPRTLYHKGLEALTALLLTARHGREAVLAQYLQLVPYANGSHGIEHAARFYLDKRAEDLSWAEIALLSSIPHSPVRLDPTSATGRERAVTRGQRILERLHQRGVLDPASLDLAQRQIGRIPIERRSARHPGTLHLLGELSQRLADRQEGGVVRATLDRPAQEYASRLVGQYLDTWRRHGAQQVAVIVVDRETMGVRALVGSGDYFGEAAGAIDFSRVPRSAGSILKPLIYAQALQAGVIEPATVLLDTRQRAGGIANADRRFLGAILPRQALATSRNVPATHQIRMLGLERSYAYLRDLGLHDDRRPASDYGIGLAIGALPVRLRDLLVAYGALASDGYLRPLRWTERDPKVQGEAVIDRDIARIITSFLADPMARLPAFSRRGTQEYDFPAASKTGTAEGYTDAWNVVYSHRHLIGVWTGRVAPEPTHGLTGANSAARLAQDLLNQLARASGNGAGQRFSQPEGYVRVPLCADGSEPHGDDCPGLRWEWRAEGAGPPAVLALSRLSRGTQRADLQITAPPSGSRIVRTPETPDHLNRLPLTAAVDGDSEQVVWYVNGRPYRVLDADTTLHWPMEAGRHRFQIGLPYRPERSPPVVVTVH